MWIWIKKNKVIIATVWGFSTTVFSIYATFFPFEKSPEVVFYEKAAQDVFSLKDTITGLDIYCNGVDVRKTEFGLKMYSVKLINKGERDVKKNDYGDALFGLQIANGKIIGVKTGKYSDGYLANNIIDKNNADSTKIVLKKLFIAKEGYVFINFWVLYNTKKEASISKPLGRIADSNILYTSEDENSDTTLKEIIQLILILGGIFITVVAIGFILLFSIYHSKRIFRRIIFLNCYNIYYDKHIQEHRIILKMYSLLGKKAFLEVCSILRDKEKLKQHYIEELANKKVVSRFTELLLEKKISMNPSKLDIKYNSDLIIAIDLLENFNYVRKMGNEIEIDEKFLREIDKALEFVR